ncbi:adenosine kinase [Acrasis kona]|uniref:Adenosine kinase n=1 Tax=Acrasis kona TaxID=1008807 RepID=A0AAW2YMI8_9EUKA
MYKVLGIGQPLLDKIFRVSEESLKKIGIHEKGGSSLIHSEAELQEMLQRIQNALLEQQEHSPDYVRNSDGEDDAPDSDTKPIIVAGGSCANTVKGISSFGERCGFIGKIGADQAGQFYKQTMSKRGVIPLMTESFGRTGQVICLVTPDGQRTMRAYLGEGNDLNESELLEQDFKGVKLVHFEGYCIYNPLLTERAMRMAKQNGALVSFDMGSFEVVRRYQTKILQLLQDYVDIVFCNVEEAAMLINGTPEECVEFLAAYCKVAIVMMGSKGCWVKSGADKHRCPTKAIQDPVDTTGAGDLFASGFLYGYLQGYTLEQCARLGSLSGAEVVQVMGAEIPLEKYAKIKQDVNNVRLVANVRESKGTSDPIAFGSSPSVSYMNKIRNV